MLNPIQQNIANGMSPLAAFFSEKTCSEACWEAREDVCRCSCFGKNHGCMRDASGIRPERTARIDGVRYVLKATAEDQTREVPHLADAINKANPRTSGSQMSSGAFYPWTSTDRGAPARVKNASKDQLARWPELASYRERIAEIRSRRHAPIEYFYIWPVLLWVREDIASQ